MLHEDGGIRQNHGKRCLEIVRGVGHEALLLHPRLLHGAQRPAAEVHADDEEDEHDQRAHAREVHGKLLPSGCLVRAGEGHVDGSVFGRPLVIVHGQVLQYAEAVFGRGHIALRLLDIAFGGQLGGSVVCDLLEPVGGQLVDSHGNDVVCVRADLDASGFRALVRA